MGLNYWNARESIVLGYLQAMNKAFTTEVQNKKQQKHKTRSGTVLYAQII